MWLTGSSRSGELLVHSPQAIRSLFAASKTLYEDCYGNIVHLVHASVSSLLLGSKGNYIQYNAGKIVSLASFPHGLSARESFLGMAPAPRRPPLLETR